MAIAHTAGMVLAIVFSIRANSPAPYPVSIAGGRLLCGDSLDEKTYARLVLDEECYYKERIEEHARALVKLERANGSKALMVRCAYITFVVSVAVIGAGFAIVLTPM